MIEIKNAVWFKIIKVKTLKNRKKTFIICLKQKGTSRKACCIKN